MVPFLGDDLKNCVENRQLKLTMTKNGFEISYFESGYPVSIIAYDNLFSIFKSASAKRLRHEWREFVNGRAAESHFTTWRKLKAKWINAIFNQERNTIQEIVDRVNNDTERMLGFTAQSALRIYPLEKNGKANQLSKVLYHQSVDLFKDGRRKCFQ